MAATSSRVREASSVPPPRPQIAGLDRKGVLTGAALVVVLLVLVYIGSEGLRWFDAALAGYLVGTLLAVFAVAYRYVVWIERPRRPSTFAIVRSPKRSDELRRPPSRSL